MRRSTRTIAGVILILVPTIEFGGYFILNILRGREAALELTSFQEAMFRAGHAHAGVLVILALAGLLLIQYTTLKGLFLWLVQLGLPAAAIFVSSGFFFSALGKGSTQPNGFIVLIYIGSALLAVCCLVLGSALCSPKKKHS